MSRPQEQIVLEVTVAHERDAAGAVHGGADRLLAVTPEGRSPEPATLSAICRESGLPVHVVLRLREDWTTTGGELTRLVGLAEDYLACGAVGVCFGFLDADLEVDVEVCTHLAESLPGVDWGFSAAIDHTLDPRRSWRRLRGLPGLTSVRSAGSPRGMSEGYDDLIADAEADPIVAALLVASNGLLAEQVPWLVRAGVRAFAVELQARPGASRRAYVDADLTRSWRRLLDSAAERL